MGMDRIIDRLRRGEGPPLRVPELAEAIGCSQTFIRDRIEEGEIKAERGGVIGRFYRIPIQEAQRVARAFRIIE